MIPNPGSDEAIKQGCTCPVLDNNHGKGFSKNMFYMSMDCPLHGIKLDKSNNSNKGEKDD